MKWISWALLAAVLGLVAYALCPVHVFRSDGCHVGPLLHDVAALREIVGRTCTPSGIPVKDGAFDPNE